MLAPPERSLPSAVRALCLLLACTWVCSVCALQGCSSSSAGAGADAALADVSRASDAATPVDAGDASMSPDTTLPADSGGATDAASLDSTTSPDTSASVDSGSLDATLMPDASDSSSASDAGADADAPFVCGPDSGMPADLSCTGLYSDWASKTVAPGVLPYTPGYVLWSDGAVKTRWISLPPGSQIDTTDMDDWVFPVNTRIWKQFVVGGQLVETRFMWKQQGGWQFFDYRWSADGSSAPLLTNGETNVNGTTYEIPALYRCGSCHSGRQDEVLGFDLVGTGVAGAQGVTLGTLVAAGQLTQPPPAVPVVIPDDATQMAPPALGWLHVNCGASCHNNNPNAMATASHLYMKLLAGQMYPDGGAALVSSLDTYTTTVGVSSNLTPNGQHYPRIAAGDAAASLVPLMDLARGADAGFMPMPPFISHIPDTADVSLVQAWINAL